MISYLASNNILRWSWWIWQFWYSSRTRKFGHKQS